MFQTNSQLRDQLETAQARITELEAESASHAAEVESLQTQLAESREELATATARVTELATAAEQHESAITAANERAEQAEAIATQRASEEVAAAGHPPVEVANEASESATPHLDKFESLKGAEASQYFAEHRDQILREARAKR